MTEKEFELFVENFVQILMDEHDDLIMEFMRSKIQNVCHKMGYVIVKWLEDEGTHFEFFKGLNGEALERVDGLRFLGYKVEIYL